MRLAKRARDFVADDDPAERGRDDAFCIHAAQLFRERGANARGDLRVLEQKRALEKLPRMQAGSQEEMAVEQSVGFTEKGEDFGIGEHRKMSKRDVENLKPQIHTAFNRNQNRVPPPSRAHRMRSGACVGSEIPSSFEPISARKLSSKSWMNFACCLTPRVV